MEQKQLYDKSRRITRLEDHSFGVPVKNTPDFRQLTEDAPASIQPIFSSGPAIIPSVKPSNSLPDRIRRLFESFCENHSEKWNSQSVLYRRSEVVGNILVLSRVSFSGEKAAEFWSELTALPSVLSKNSPSAEWSSLFHRLLELTKCSRVGIHHEIDCGPKRQSHSRIVYSEVEAEDGWVTLRQVAFFSLLSLLERRFLLLAVRARDVRQWKQHGAATNGRSSRKGRVCGRFVRGIFLSFSHHSEKKTVFYVRFSFYETVIFFLQIQYHNQIIK